MSRQRNPPIVKDKIYCGDRNELPDFSYDRFGTPKECLSKGVGVGLYIPKNKNIILQDDTEDTKYEKNMKSFFHENINATVENKRNKNIKDVFKNLAQLWRIQNR